MDIAAYEHWVAKQVLQEPPRLGSHEVAAVHWNEDGDSRDRKKVSLTFNLTLELEPFWLT
jgi:hypothetical protein